MSKVAFLYFLTAIIMSERFDDVDEKVETIEATDSDETYRAWAYLELQELNTEFAKLPPELLQPLIALLAAKDQKIDQLFDLEGASIDREKASSKENDLLRSGLRTTTKTANTLTEVSKELLLENQKLQQQLEQKNVLIRLLLSAKEDGVIHYN